MNSTNQEHITSEEIKKYWADAQYVSEHISTDDALLQLAEEAAEVAAAASKLARVRKGTNPSPSAHDECLNALIEELSDMSDCLEICEICESSKIMNQKMARWADRLREANNGSN